MNQSADGRFIAAFELRPRPPFRLALTVWALRRQAHNIIDRWDGEHYRRVLALDTGAVEINVRQIGLAQKPRLVVDLHSEWACESKVRVEVHRQLRRMLGLDVDLSSFYALAAHENELNTLVQRFIGMRPPRYPSLFEALANAVACQQISLNVGIAILNRLTECFGTAAGEGYAFPRPHDLLRRADPLALRALGFSLTKARTLLHLAELCMSGVLETRVLARLSDAEAIKELTAVPGIGRWSAEYVLLRGLGRWHVFPGDDVGARKHLAQWLQLEGTLDYNRVVTVLQRWREYGGLIYFHLLLRRLEQSGMLKPSLQGTQLK
jgi:DNA-3-methyladenine glycosylase II